MSFAYRLLPAVLALTCLPNLAPAESLPSDPALTTGELDNGLRYIVFRHTNPPGRAVMWIHFHTGSLNETDRQRGLAHYLEHMSFNGSENFAPGALIPFFQSLGMTFGRDQNAFTNFEQTTYQLSLPDAKPETLRKGMTFFADILHRLLLLPKEIDDERGIIQEERRRGLSGRQRTSFYVLEHIAPGSLYGQRITIGTEETIDGVREADFRDYYGKWYAASNATLMVVADTDPAEVVAAIKEQFGGAPKRPRPTPQASGVKAYDKSFAIVCIDPEVKSESLRVTRLEPAQPPTTTVEQFRTDLIDEIGAFAFNRRLEAAVDSGKTSYLSGRASVGNETGILHEAELSGQAKPGQWRSALRELIVELQRARAFGFTPREIEDARKQIMSSAVRAVETEPTRPASAVISRMNGRVTAQEPILSAQQTLDLVKKVLPEITAQEVTAEFAREYDPNAVAFVAIMPGGGSVPTEAELLEAGTQAVALAPQRMAEREVATELLPKLPEPGTVTEGTLHEASGVWSGWLSNGVRVHHRFMDIEKNEVTISVALLGGELHEKADNRGVTQAAQLAWSHAATKHLTSSDIRELMTGKKIAVRGGGGGGGRGRGGRGGGEDGPGAEAITLTVAGSPDDLETGLQLAYLLLTEPKVESAAFEQYKTRARQMLEEVLHNPLMFGGRLAASAPFPPDEPRTQPLTIEQIDKLTPEQAQGWLDKLIAESPIEVSIVGDIPRERATDLVARYIGALSQRPRVTPQLFTELRKLKRPAGPTEITRTIQTDTPQAFVMSAFYGPNENQIADVRALSLATRILSTRMVKEIREDAQLVYSISAGLRPGITYPGFGLVSAASPTEPAKVPALVKKIAEMYAAFAKDGVTAEELEVAKKQVANNFDEQMRQPSFWLARLTQMTFRDRSLDEFMAAPTAYQAITADQVREAFAKYYAPERAVVVTVQPEAAAAPPAASDKKP